MASLLSGCSGTSGPPDADNDGVPDDEDALENDRTGSEIIDDFRYEGKTNQKSIRVDSYDNATLRVTVTVYSGPPIDLQMYKWEQFRREGVGDTTPFYSEQDVATSEMTNGATISVPPEDHPGGDLALVARTGTTEKSSVKIEGITYE